MTRERKPIAEVAGREGGVGWSQATAAAQNRELGARRGIVQAFQRLGIPFHQWPEMVQKFHADAGQQVEYHQYSVPPPFRAPRFDRLSQTPIEWMKIADRAWVRHRDRFLHLQEAWIEVGVDEAIVARRRRGGGKPSASAGKGRRRGENTTLERRYECAARYLMGDPIKDIATLEEDPSSVGRVARDVIRSAGWSPSARARARVAPPVHELYPKAKYHATKRTQVVQNADEEAALGADWSDTPRLKAPATKRRPKAE